MTKFRSYFISNHYLDCLSTKDESYFSYATISELGVKELILSDYDLGEIETCKFHCRGVNDTYQIKSKIERYALRVYSYQLHSFEEIESEINIIQHLHSHKIPVGFPVPLRNGKMIGHIQSPEGVRYYVLFKWSTGENLQYSNTQGAFNFGEASAKMHNALKEYNGSMKRQDIDLDCLVHNSIRKVLKVCTHSYDNQKYFEKLSDRFPNKFERISSKELEWNICHGDLHGGNANLQDSQVNFYDFDFCGPGWSIYDLATFQWATILRDQKDIAWQPFFSGYSGIRKLSDQDISMIPFFVFFRHIWFMGFQAEQIYYSGESSRTKSFFEPNFDFLKKLESDLID